MKDSLVKKVTEMRAVLFFLLITFFLHVHLDAQNPVKILFYNTENLFDAVDDSTTDDEEFLPEGTRRWTDARYHKKLNAIARVIIAAGGWHSPDVVGLCEVENRQVVLDLTKKGLLAESGYSFVHYDSPDQRGIDLCMLYRTDRVRVINHESWIPPSADGRPFKSRNILFVRTLIKSDTIDFIFCHWPSRREGIITSSAIRSEIAAYISFKTDSINQYSGGADKIVLLGDLNASTSDTIVANLAEKIRLVNLTSMIAQKQNGSYRYRGEWEMIDQALLSEALLTEKEYGSDECKAEIRVCDFDFLLEDDPDYPGKRPFSTYREYKWQGGYSDHLPILLTICL